MGDRIYLCSIALALYPLINVLFIKIRRIAWLSHVMRMNDKKIPKRILEWKPIGTGIRGRPRKRRIADIEEDTCCGRKEMRLATLCTNR